MALSNLDLTNKLYADLDDLNPRSNPAVDGSVDNVTESPTGVYTTSEIVVDCTTKKFWFLDSGTSFPVAGSGITGQALYSFFKYLWKNVSTITKYDFPMLSITNEQFEFINGWTYDDTQTLTQDVVVTGTSNISFDNGTSSITTTSATLDFRQFEDGDTIVVSGTAGGTNDGSFTVSGTPTKSQIIVTVAPADQTDQSAVLTSSNFTSVSSQLVRTAGWTVQDSTATYVKEIYSGLITLGTLVDVTDQPYFIQDSSLTATIRNTKFTGPANQAVAIFARADSTVATGNSQADIAFDGANGISSTTTDLSVFKAGDTITVTNTDSNNATYTVTGTPTATSLSIVEAGTSEVAGPATIVADRRSTFKIFVRERGKTYADADLADIGVTGNMTYIVYRFPVSNATDLKIETTADSQISSGTVVPATVNPYDDIQIKYLQPASGESYVIKGDVTVGTVTENEVYKDAAGRWFKVTATGTIDANGVADYTNTGGTATLAQYEGERFVKNAYYAFTVIIDANDNHANSATETDPYVDGTDNTRASNVYEFAQWALRLSGDLNEGNTGDATEDARTGAIADLLVDYVGETLVTRSGVFVDSLASLDQNAVQFTEASSSDYTGTSNLTYPRVVTVRINFNTNLSEDGDGIYAAYYTTTPNGLNFGETDAALVVSASGNTSGTIPTEAAVGNDAGAGSFITFQYDYDGDDTGGRDTVSPTDVGITVVGIGLDTGQYVKATGTITTAGGTVSLVAPLERNYLDPA